MKICVTSEGISFNSRVDTRFGRCRFFIIADSDTLERQVLENPNVESTGGAGIQSAQLIATHQVKAVLTGNIGPNAFQTLQAAGVEVFTGASGTVMEAIEKYKKGELKVAFNPSVNSKFGMGK